MEEECPEVECPEVDSPEDNHKKNNKKDLMLMKLIELLKYFVCY